MLRQKDLCPTPPQCPYVLMEDPGAGSDALPCAECPALLLREYLASPAGSLLQVVIDLDFAIQAGVSVSLGQIQYPEFLLLRMLVEERDAYQVEEMKKNSAKRS